MKALTSSAADIVPVGLLGLQMKTEPRPVSDGIRHRRQNHVVHA